MLLSRFCFGRAYNKPSLSRLRSTCRRSLTSGSEYFQEGDCAFVRCRGQEPILTKPLHPGGKTSSRWGEIKHDNLIGKQARELVTTSKGREVRVSRPTLEEYVLETSRLVTPIYPADANVIVSLLDIHVSAQHSVIESGPSLEILEAGTGHGALTLHLARAIHAANPPASSQDEDLQRNALIHTLDISSKHSGHGRKIVEGFRRGMYAKDVKFHVGDVSKWIDQQQEHRDATNKTFLSHVILDLPSSHSHIEKAAFVLRADGNLLVFNPNVTQVGACVELIRKKRLPLQLERILELGPAVTGGREWDVRLVKPRAMVDAENEKKLADVVTIAEKTSEKALLEGVLLAKTRDEEQAQASEEDDTGWEMVCRPKAWGRTIGGGFLAVWKKKRQRFA